MSIFILILLSMGRSVFKIPILRHFITVFNVNKDTVSHKFQPFAKFLFNLFLNSYFAHVIVTRSYDFRDELVKKTLNGKPLVYLSLVLIVLNWHSHLIFIAF
jgi:hypothetical protein